MFISILRALSMVSALTLVHTSLANAQENVEPRPHEFVNSCTSCHGADGKGAGFLTRLFKGVDPGDLTQLAAKNNGMFPFNQVFQVIDGRVEVAAHGDRKMPVWGDRYMGQSMDDYGPDELNDLRVRNRILELVNYLQSIQGS